MTVLERFLRYVKTDTQSDPETGHHPSTEKQFNLARILLAELHEMGVEALLDDHCYLYASLPANREGLKTIGFIAHMDTEPVVSGKDVKPQIVRYLGGAVPLSPEKVLSADEFPSLNAYLGEELVVTDGTTLLGADDKAGVAEIMQLVECLTDHPEIPHGKIGIAFTPDEEIGEGADFFDVQKFGCEFAYTVDGGPIGEISYETFNAASALFTFHGRNIHPGFAKGKMRNCCLMIQDALNCFPAEETPAATEGREGFYHVEGMESGIETGKLSLIIRDHDKTRFEERKEFVRSVQAVLEQKYGTGSVEVEVKDSYYNMKEKIEPHMHLVENAEKAIRAVGVTPFRLAVRGGTDGSRLSFMGLPCPNLGTGGHNCHSIYEYISVSSLEKGVEVLKHIVALYAEP